MKEVRSSGVTIQRGERSIRLLRTSVARVFLAGLLIGAVACKDPNGPISDGSLVEICQRIRDTDYSKGRPLVLPKSVSPIPPGSNEPVNENLFLIDESDNQLWLTNDPDVDDYYPVISPDKQRVAFVRNGSFKKLNDESFTHNYSGKEGIYVINIDGTSLQRLTHFPSNEVRDDFPSWSSDAKMITFARRDTSKRPFVESLYKVNSDGSDLTMLLESSEENMAVFRPQFSPDGSLIAFQDWSSTYVIGKDGSNLTKVSEGFNDDTKGIDGGFLWLPNSRQLIVHKSFRTSDISFSQRNRLVSVDGWENRDISLLCPPRQDPREDF